MWITAVMMVIEIIAGWWFNSMALLADGWHMSSHAVAIGLSAFAYAAARRYARDTRFAFGTWKIEVLGGFASSLFLLGAVLVAVWARGLITETAKVLLDREMDQPVVQEIREAVETAPDAGDTRVADLHVWRVGKRAYACAIMLVTHDEKLTANRVREQLAQHEEIVHATIEINLCANPTPTGQPA